MRLCILVFRFLDTKKKKKNMVYPYKVQNIFSAEANAHFRTVSLHARKSYNKYQQNAPRTTQFSDLGSARNTRKPLQRAN